MPSVKSKRNKEFNPVSSQCGDVLKVRNHLRKRLIELRACDEPIKSWEEHRRHVFDLLKRTALLAESNSVLVIGPRGCGKTTLLDGVLEELYAIDDVKENMLLVNMNGLIQTDDRIALKEITLQLQLENVVGDRVFGSFAENLTFLLEAFKSGNSDKKSILFILDEFDLFCHHKNQTLLYNLFDVAQSAQAPIAVVGLTCRLDVVELLEKRVKSRFSHRQIYLLNQISFDEYKRLFINLLSVSDNLCDETFTRQWNKHIKALLNDSNVHPLLKKMFDMDKNIKKLKSLLIIPVLKLSQGHPKLDTNHFLIAFKSLNHNSKISTLQGLSVLEMCLIIAMKRLTVVYDGEPSNFQMLYHEYQKLGQHSSMQHFDKSVVSKAFERLQALELIVPIDGIHSKVQKEYQLMNLVVDPTEISNTLKNNYTGLPTEVQQWALTNI